jgi:arabinogalactan oligomer/maltooligosaccharide transport system permease protein
MAKRFRSDRFERSDHPVKIVLIYAVLILMSLLSLVPIWNVVHMSLRPSNQLYTTKLSFIPPNWTLDNFRVMLFEKPLLGWMANSVIVSVITAVLAVAIAATTGYAIARFRYMGRGSFMTFLLTTQMFPAPMLLLPTYLLLTKLGLLNTYAGLIIPYVATSIPFAVWMMKGFYDTVPIELEYAAAIDGASNLRTFWSITLPLAKPALAITALFSFMTGWSEYVIARLILTKPDFYTLPVGLVQLQTQFTTEWGRYAAGALITMIPAMIVFMVFSRFLVSGLTLGSVKG